MKQIITKITLGIILLSLFTACSSNDEPDNVFDWNVITQTWAITHQGNKTNKTKISQEEYVEKNKTEDQMRLLKLEYEAESNEYFDRKYNYSKIK